jgi:hypothetical protein
MFQSVLPIAATERRYACFYADNRYSGIQNDRIAQYFKEVRAVPSYLVAWLHYFKLAKYMSGFDPRAIPVTQATTDQKVRSLDSTTRFILNILQTSTPDEWKANFAPMTLPQWHAHYTKWAKDESLSAWSIMTLQAFSEVMQTLLRPKLVRIMDNGRRTSDRSQFALSPDLIIQRITFSNALQLTEFPQLSVTPEDAGDDGAPDVEEDGFVTPKSTCILSLMLDDDISEDEREDQASQLAKRKRAETKSCPAPGCHGRHASHYRLNRHGAFIPCSSRSPGAFPYHSEDTDGFTVPGSSPARKRVRTARWDTSHGTVTITDSQPEIPLNSVFIDPEMPELVSADAVVH